MNDSEDILVSYVSLEVPSRKEKEVELLTAITVCYDRAGLSLHDDAERQVGHRVFVDDSLDMYDLAHLIAEKLAAGENPLEYWLMVDGAPADQQQHLGVGSSLALYKRFLFDGNAITFKEANFAVEYGRWPTTQEERHTLDSLADRPKQYVEMCRSLVTFGGEFIPGERRIGGVKTRVLLGATRTRVLIVEESSGKLLSLYRLDPLLRWKATPNIFVFDFKSEANIFTVYTKEAQRLEKIINVFLRMEQ